MLTNINDWEFKTDGENAWYERKAVFDNPYRSATKEEVDKLELERMRGIIVPLLRDNPYDAERISIFGRLFNNLI